MKHYIIVKYNERVRDRSALQGEIEALFAPATRIEGVKSVEVRPAVILSEKRYDLMILLEMEREALALFDQSEIHRLWKERYADYLSAKTIFDCD